MRTYAYSGYGFDEYPMDFKRVKDFIDTQLPPYLREHFKDAKSIDDLEWLCSQSTFDVDVPALPGLLAIAIADRTGQDVQACWDDSTGGYRVLLLPSYPWDKPAKPMTMVEYVAIASVLAKEFYGTEVSFDFDGASFYG